MDLAVFFQSMLFHSIWLCGCAFNRKENEAKIERASPSPSTTTFKASKSKISFVDKIKMPYFLSHGYDISNFSCFV